MKHLSPIISFCLLLALPVASSAGSFPWAAKKRPHTVLLEAIGIPKAPSSSNTAQKGAGIKSRMTAYAFAVGNNGSAFENQDSAIYRYPNPNTEIPASDLGFTWNGTGYDSTGRDTYVYNSNGMPLSQVNQTWDGTVWVNNYRVSNSWNQAGDDTSVLFEMWDGTTWINYFRQLNTYNSQHSMTSMTFQMWSNTTNSWVGNSRELYTYTATNKVATYQYEQWDPGTSAYEPLYRELSYYNSSDFQTDDVSFAPNGTGWTASDSTHYTSLNTAGMPLVGISYTSNGGIWNVSYRTTYTYNASNLRTSALYESWNGNAYENSQREFDTYNTFDQQTSYYTQTWDGTNWMMSQDDYRIRYYYENYTPAGVGTHIATSALVSLYPNPAADFAQLSVTSREPIAFTVSVSDALGKVWQQWQVPSSTTYSSRVSTASLPSGIYYINISVQGQNTTSKLLVQH